MRLELFLSDLETFEELNGSSKVSQAPYNFYPGFCLIDYEGNIGSPIGQYKRFKMTETEFSLEMGASVGTSAVAKWWKMKKISDLKNIPKLNWATWFKTRYHSRPADGRYYR